MSNVKVQWVKYKKMGGPRYLGQRDKGVFLHEFHPSKPWGVWSQILGVVAGCEGRHDTVVMYDETGVTAGAFQWTFKSGRLQSLLEYFKTIRILNFEEYEESTLFQQYCEVGGRQIFKKYGFEINGGYFQMATVGEDRLDKLNMRKPSHQKIMVDVCMGRYVEPNSIQKQKRFAMDLCREFVLLGQYPDIQMAMGEFAKAEFKRALNVNRSALSQVGDGKSGKIRDLIPEDVWGTPIPAIFFCLYQNSPKYTYKLFSKVMEVADKKGLVKWDHINGYELDVDSDISTKREDLLDLLWKRLCLTSYCDWGFKSRQYIKSEGKNPPRVKNMKSVIRTYYGVDLPYTQ